MRRPASIVPLSIALSLVLSIATSAVAGGLRVGPTRLVLTEAAPVGSVSVSNAGGGDLVVELEPMDWSVPNAGDDYRPSDELVATPLIFHVPPGRTQIVRVGLRNGMPAQGEKSFRLYVREVLPDEEAMEGGLHIALRIGVPIFAHVTSTSPGMLDWRVRRSPDGSCRLRAENSGASFVHVKFVELTVAGAQRPLVSSQEAGYVLSGAAHEWSGADGAALASARTAMLRVESDEGVTQVEVPIDR